MLIQDTPDRPQVVADVPALAWQLLESAVRHPGFSVIGGGETRWERRETYDEATGVTEDSLVCSDPAVLHAVIDQQQGAGVFLYYLASYALCLERLGLAEVHPADDWRTLLVYPTEAGHRYHRLREQGRLKPDSEIVA